MLWSFGAAGDGQVPAAGLIADKWGNLYGTTTAGGANSCALSEFGSGCGTVFGSVRRPANRRNGASACCGALLAALMTAQFRSLAWLPISGAIFAARPWAAARIPVPGRRSGQTAAQCSSSVRRPKNRRNGASACCGVSAKLVTESHR